MYRERSSPVSSHPDGTTSTRAGPCLDPDDVAAYLGGDLAPPEVLLLESHVARCAACRTLVSLAARSDSVLSSPASLAARGDSASPAPQPPSGAPGDPGDPAPGALVGRYVLGRRLGAGAMGVVFAAHDPELDRNVAVKLLRSDADDPARALSVRLLREAQAMAQLAHPNVVAVHDVGSFGDRIFIAMELVDGETLAAWLAAAPRPLRDVLARFVAAGHGLAAAHAAGLVHRDFKPENVLIGKDGRVRVTDFGLAHRAALPLEPAAAPAAGGDRATALFAGTPFYMAPEQLARERVDARTDQFSFCVAICAALTGEHPFPRDRVDRFAGPPRRGALPAWLWRAVQPGLSIARDRRYPSMDALLARLAAGPRRRTLALAGAAAAVAAIAASAAGAGLAGGTSGPTCDGAGRLMATAWGPAQADAIDRAFRATGRADGAATLASASLLLDQYARRWIAMRTEACERVQPDDQIDAAVDLRIRCLDARLSELRTLTSRLSTADAPLVDGALVAVQSLGKLAICADDHALQRPTHRDVASRPGATAAVDPGHRFTYFVTDADKLLWQVRPGAPARTPAQVGSGAGAERAYVVDDVVGHIAVVEDADHRLQLFARRVNATVSRAWQLPDGAWQAEQFADTVADDPAAILVAGRLVAFVRRTDGWLWRYWQDGSTWTSVRVADVAAGTPGLGLDAAGELYSFVRKPDSSLWLARHRDPAGPPDRAVKLAESAAGDPVVALDVARKLTVFVRRLDGSLLVRYQAVAGSPTWHGVVLTTGVAGSPALAADAEGKQVCLIRKTDGSLWLGTQRAPAAGPWHEAILTTGVADDPTLVLDADQRLTYLVHKTDGSLWQGRQDAPRSATWHEQPLR